MPIQRALRHRQVGLTGADGWSLGWPYTERWSPNMAQKPSVVHSDPEILGGTPVFTGPRVPMKNLYDYLEAGDSLNEFLDDFPSVTREHAIAVLELGREMTETHASVA